MKKHNRRLSFQSLESRNMMAGDVAVAHNSVGDIISLTGDGLGNQVEISQHNFDVFRIRGINNTSINGVPNGVENFDVNGDDTFFDINLKGGTDRLVAVGLLNFVDAIFVDSGAGADDLQFYDTELFDLTLKTRGGADKVLLNNLNILDDLTINTQAAAGDTVDDSDIVTLVNISAFDVTRIDTGLSNDRVTLRRSLFDTVIVNGGAGTDTFVSDQSFWNELFLNSVERRTFV